MCIYNLSIMACDASNTHWWLPPRTVLRQNEIILKHWLVPTTCSINNGSLPWEEEEWRVKRPPLHVYILGGPGNSYLDRKPVLRPTEETLGSWPGTFDLWLPTARLNRNLPGPVYTTRHEALSIKPSPVTLCTAPLARTPCPTSGCT